MCPEGRAQQFRERKEAELLEEREEALPGWSSAGITGGVERRYYQRG